MADQKRERKGVRDKGRKRRRAGGREEERQRKRKREIDIGSLDTLPPPLTQSKFMGKIMPNSSTRAKEAIHLAEKPICPCVFEPE